MKAIAINSVKLPRTNTYVIRYNIKHQASMDELLEKAKQTAQTAATHQISERTIPVPRLKIVDYGIGALKTPETSKANPSNLGRLAQKAAKRTRAFLQEKAANLFPSQSNEYRLIGIETSRVPLVKKIITAAEKLRAEDSATEVIKAQGTNITLDDFFMTKGLQQVSEYNWPPLEK